MRLIVPHLPNRGPHFDDEVIDLTDRLAPYESSAWRAPQQEPPVEPTEPTLVEPETLDAVHAAPPVVDVPETLDLVLAQLVEEEAEALEAAMHPVVAERGLGPAAPRQPRNERCACGSGRKYKRCCGEWRDAP